MDEEMYALLGRMAAIVAEIELICSTRESMADRIIVVNCKRYREVEQQLMEALMIAQLERSIATVKKEETS